MEAVAVEIAAVVNKIKEVEEEIGAAKVQMRREECATDKNFWKQEIQQLRDEKNKLRDKEATLLQLNVKASPPASTAGA